MLFVAPPPQPSTPIAPLALMMSSAVGPMVSPSHAPSPAAPGTLAQGDIVYGRDVRPILSDRCFLCHGPDRSKQQAKLRLDRFDEATRPREDGAAIVPGDPDASLIWQRITSSDPDEYMPPPDSHKQRLSDGERDIIRRWIESGARYEDHWAFVPPTRPTPPSGGRGVVQHPIDAFIRARLANAGISPSPRADAATLVRRLYLDLTGLPPTPEESAAFIADTAPDAVPRLVRTLLNTEPYRTRHAERMATPWLDVARYADTSGIHMDAGRSIWPWRDWVIAAYRDNMPFSRFVIEQLAGDLLPNATRDQLIASGFNRNHVTSDEGGAIDAEYLLEYAADRVATTGAAFLGLSVQCARCHDHKFDPITTDDYYSLIAFFNSNKEPGIYSQVTNARRALEPELLLPSADDDARLKVLEDTIAAARAKAETPTDSERAALEAFAARLRAPESIEWSPAPAVSATSDGGATLAIQPDGSVLARGENPDNDIHRITFETQGTGSRLIRLDVLDDPSLPYGRAGRGDNGNAVLDGIEITATSVADPSKSQQVRLVWAWADTEQANEDLAVVNALKPGDGRVWGIDAHAQEGRRTALFLADEPFGFKGGTRLSVTLTYKSPFARHTFGRVGLGVARVSDELLAQLPEATSRWYIAGPWPTKPGTDPYATLRGPEAERTFNPKSKWGDFAWRFTGGIVEGEPAGLAQGEGSECIARQIFLPTERDVYLSLGSDDGLMVYVDGALVHEERVDRGVSLGQSQVKVRLPAGEHVLLFKVVNTGGPGAFAHRAMDPEGVMARATVALALPEGMAREPTLDAARAGWRERNSAEYMALATQIRSSTAQRDELAARIPRTMVMHEKDEPTATFVMKRGLYDQPDASRPVTRAIPAVLGTMPESLPPNRLGLAQWLISAQNPLTARVTMNRLWEQFFGMGIVRTESDFGLQGAWPTHPELLDWLAVEFRESGWDMRHMIELIVTSETYAQSSRRNEPAAKVDPANSLLAWFPRQRLGAEQIRDQALFVSGLLVERTGGESVKPYQPGGLWEEVAMVQSNTRTYERGMGDDLWRRSLYTYWKRALPPPSMMAFDAPTREYCVTRRGQTNTPLQALVLWNDEQFVEAARVAAARAIADARERNLDDAAALDALFLRCTGRTPDATIRALLRSSLASHRENLKDRAEDARQMLAAGESPLPTDIDPRELAAWSLVASSVMSSDACIVKD